MGNEFVLPTEVVKQLVNHFNTLNPTSLILSGKGKSISLKIENKNNELTVDFDIAKEVEAFKVKLAKLFVEILSVIGSEVSLSVKDGSPVYLNVKKSDAEFEYIIAPLGK